MQLSDIGSGEPEREIEALRRRVAELERSLEEARALAGVASPHDVAGQGGIERGGGDPLQYETLFREMSEAFALHEVVLDEAGRPYDYRFLMVNPAFERVTGLSRDSVVGRTMREVLPGVGDDWIQRQIKVAMGGGSSRLESYSAVLNRWYQVVLYSPAPGLFACLFMDATESKLAAAALQESEERYRTLTERSPDVIFRFDRQFRHLYANPAVERITGMPPSAFVGKTHRELGFAAEACDAWERQIQEVFDTGRDKRSQFEYLGPNGSVFFDWHTTPECLPDGTVQYVMSFSRDITGLKRAEAAAAESERRFRLAMMVSPLPSVIHAEDGEIVLVNDAWVEISGYSREELRTLGTWTKLAYGDGAGAIDADIACVFDSSERLHMGETVVRTAGGQERIWDFWAAPLGLLPDGRRAAVAVAADVTERQAAEARLNKVSRMYRVLSQVNESMMRVRDVDCLFPEVCRIVVEDGGFCLAWIGVPDGATGRVVPVARCGPSAGFLDDLVVSTLGNVPEGRGP